MKRIVQKYRICKFKRITDGLVFAVISVIALTLCLTDILDHTTSLYDIILPFVVAVISMLMGFVVMFRENTI
ncbi:MAG: hypothetical protein K0S76_2369 [Herbinix sp.]|jgi:hypothetical protein|nr:hypothetical protein [Herbinix sp.]